jgi:type I restriction enzyme S subunit
MKKYQSYKPSGNLWIGDIPEHWEIKRLKHLSSINGSNVDKNIYEDEKQVYLCNYTDVYYNKKITDKVEFKKGSCTNEEYEKFKLKNDDIIITKDSETPDDIGVPSYVTSDFENVVCGYHLSMISTNKDHLNGEYLFRQLQTKRVRNYFEINSNGITRYGLGKSPIENLDVVTPPIKDQLQIVSYLNEKTELIDKLISTKERKIDLLKLQRTSLINQVVTKGLDPKVKMKDSGVDWIGEIPYHWETTKLKHTCEITYGISPPDTTYNDEGIGVELVNGPVEYSTTDFGFTRSSKWTTEPKKFCKKGSLLFCLRGSTTGRMNISHKDLSIGRGVCSINSKGIQWFMIYSMFILRIHIQEKISGSTFPSVVKDDVDNFIICNPPLDEQKLIVEHLDNQTKEIDDLMTMEQRKIDLLKEYKQTLISEVVTGKIDVITNLN